MKKLKDFKVFNTSYFSIFFDKFDKFSEILVTSKKIPFHMQLKF
jgi:hypothetical protein